MIVADVMTKDVKTLSPHASLKEAAREMVARGFSGMPVVEEDGRLVGILTESDFINPHQKGPRARRLLHALFGDGEASLADAEVAEELMTRDVVVVGPSDSTRQAARLMAKRRVKRLPVVDGSGRVVGIVSRADLLKTFARQDDEIEAEIRSTLEAIDLPLDPDQLTITVAEGQVTVEGRTETSGDADLLERLIGALEGVSGVTNHLTWDVDLSRREQRWPGFDQGGAPGHP